MLATLGGLLALLLGLAVLLLPLLTPELSRPRDSAWGALVLLLGLVLVTSADRLSGAPMLGVLCGGLLIGRLGSEVGQARWRQLSEEERGQIGSASRWRERLDQLLAALGRLLELVASRVQAFASRFGGGRQPRGGGKRWVRPDVAGEPAAAPADPSVREVAGFEAIETLLVEAGALKQEPEGDGAG
ncbi:Ycf66 family protein [Cyanobium sp. FGCU-52]|nr:Ycf66 family protein [Cyanobium sp. FGCU52]